MAMILLPIANALTNFSNINNLYNKALFINHFDINWSIDNSTYKNYANGSIIDSAGRGIGIENTSCIIGGCVNLTNIDAEYQSITISSIPEYNMNDNNFSVMCWVKYTKTTTQAFFARTQPSTGTNKHWALYNGLDSGTSPFLNVWRGTTGGAGVTTSATGIATNTGTWQMITGVFNSTDMSLNLGINQTFRDSTPLGTFNMSQNDTNPKNLSFGATFNPTVAEAYNGSLDECVFFNKTLSSQDLSALWNGGSGISLAYNNLTNLNISVYQEGTSQLILKPVSIKIDSNIYVRNITTATGSFVFENVSFSDYTITVSSTGHTTRTYFKEINNTEITFLNTYLANNSAYTAITLAIKDQTTTQSIEGAIISIYDKIGTEWTLMAQAESDVTGLAIFDLDTTKTYRIIVEKQGYTTKTTNLQPNTATSYTINLLSTSDVNLPSISEGITYFFNPQNTQLTNNTKYNFTFNMTSTFWTITGCTMTLKNSTTIFLKNSSTFNSSACNIIVEFNTLNYSQIISSVTYQLNTTNNNTLSYQYTIRYFYKGQYSLKVVLDDIKNFTDVGFNDFSRWILSMLVIIGSIVYLGRQNFAALQNPEGFVILVIVEVWFFSYLGWMKIPLETIPSDWARQYIFAILISMVGIAYILDNQVVK